MSSSLIFWQLAWRSTVILLAVVLVVVAVVGFAPAVEAHGFGDRYDLPVPLSLWVGGAAVAVILSFVVIGLFVRHPTVVEGYPRVNLLRWRMPRILVDPRLWWAGRITSVALLALVVAAGTFGSQGAVRSASWASTPASMYAGALSSLSNPAHGRKQW